jgi:uncharacterized protein (DUF488 family)
MRYDESMNPLFTIGHSNRPLAEFLDILRENEVTAVADVRSSPFSRWCPQFNREALQRSLKEAQIEYVFLGKELGARRDEPECYRNDVAEYELIAKTPAFARGLDRVRRGAKTHRIVLLCAEKDPLTCHRTILVCRQLRDEIAIEHIVEGSRRESQEAAETRLLKLLGVAETGLFQNRADALNEAYDRQAAEIAYRRKAKR